MDHVIGVYNHKTKEAKIVDCFYKRDASPFIESYLYDYIVSLTGLNSMPPKFNSLIYSKNKKPEQDNLLYIQRSKVNMNKYTIVEKITHYGIFYNDVEYIKHISIYCFKDKVKRSSNYDINKLFSYKDSFDEVIKEINNNFVDPDEIKILP